jgi:glycosyltransferase involved in cell wall biosynthesis
MDRKNCLHLLPQSNGGIRQHFLTIIDTLMELPLNHLVCGPADDYLEKELTKRSLKYVALKWVNGQEAKNILPVTMNLKKIIVQNNINLIHSHGHKMSMVGRLASLFNRNVKTIITLHNFSPSGYSGMLLKRFNQLLDNRTAKIIAVSQALVNGEVLLANYSKTVVIYNGIDLMKFNNDNVPDQEVKVIGITARLAPQKGINTLLKSFQQLEHQFPQLKLNIIGEGPEKAFLEKLACELGIAEKTFFLGSVSNIIPALHDIDIFIMPSISEGLSIATIEALALRKPVVASKTGGLTEVVEAGVSGLLVEPGCDQMLAQAIKRLIIDVDLRKSLGESGRKRAEELFDVKQMLSKTKQIYEELIN